MPSAAFDGAILLQLSAAAQQRRQVEICYQSRDATTTRQVDPYSLVYHGERWYLVGRCHLRQDVRVFRLDRLHSVVDVDATFALPDGFDGLEAVLKSLALAPWGWEVEVLLETTLEDARQRVPPGSAVLEAVPGGVVLRGQVDRLDWLARVLMLLERPFIVRRPVELREALRRLALEAATLAERIEVRA